MFENTQKRNYLYIVREMLPVIYDYADLNELGLARSISIHKSQGSEYPVVILPLYMQHYLLLSRNLVYTGLTRAKKLAIVVGSNLELDLSIRNTLCTTEVHREIADNSEIGCL
jgi:ATP-dependent exoDNAse (exonuclease V) alpha subunit